MRLKFLLCLALVLSDESNPAFADENAATKNPPTPSAGQMFRSTNYGFEFSLPQGWTARETNFYIAHYSDGFLTVNSQRPNLILSSGWGDAKPLSQQMQPGEVYISMGYSGGPGPETMRADTLGDNLRALLATNRISASYEAGLSCLGLQFFKRGKWWNISACLRDPVTEENRQKVMSLLRSFRFIEAPVGNAAWAESLAWKKLPERIRDTGDWWRTWPVVGQVGERSAFANGSRRSVSVTNSDSTYSVKFTLQGIGEWSYRVMTNGEVESEPPIVRVASPPPSQWPSDLPDTDQGMIDVSWIAPYVQASKAFGKMTITWFTQAGQADKQISVSDVNPASGFVEIIGHPNVVVGINEDWRITPRKVVPQPDSPDERYAESTPDSRVFVYQYNSKPGTVGLDIYIHGERVNTLGPFFLYYPSHEVVLNDDGSAALLVAKTNVQFNPNAPGKDGNTLRDELSAIHRLPAQIVVLNTNGEVRFRTDCENAVWDPIVAPNGAGVLLRPNTGTNQNTYMWFTEKGELHAMDISPNPQCVGWIPQTCQSLFKTQLGFETTHFELIDWSAGKRLWDIPFPGGGEMLAVGLTPKFIIFSVAEPYPSGVWHRVNESLLQSGQEWVRTFYAVGVQDGKLVARWQGQFPHRYFDASRDYFLRLGGKLFYITADEFTELNPNDISAKQHGWK
jgi:hypothetical protein